MKKYIVLGIVLTLALAAISIAPTPGAHTEDEPFVTDLIAGGGNPSSAIDVGEIQVWNDADYVYVTYIIDEEDWVITETHLYVGKTDPTLLTSAPGQFPYSEDHDPPETTVPYVIALGDIDSYHLKENKNGNPTGKWVADETLGVGPEDTIYVAAHAVVERTETGTFTPELTWQRSTEPDSTLFYPGYGAQWTPTQAFAIPLDPSQIVWDNGVYYNNGVPAGREWASWKYAYTDPDGGSYAGYSDLRRFQASFTVPDGYVVTGGNLYTTSFSGGIPINDNIYIFVNGQDNLLFWGGTRVYTGQIPGTFLGIIGRPAARGATEPKETDRWYIPGTIPEVTDFVPGINEIDIFTEENERWGGMGKLMLELDYEITYSETAWGEGDEFSNNWAMCFTYDIQWTLLETIEIPAIGTKMTSVAVLEDGHQYKFEASGTCNWRVPPSSGGYLGDAEYWLRHDIHGEGWTHMGIWSLAMWDGTNPVEVEWGAYNDAHEYTVVYIPSADGSVTFFFNDDVYSDNSGFLTVKIYG